MKEIEVKDFVHHLRTIHFTMVIVCLVLTIGATSPSKYEYELATQQINSIEAGFEDFSSKVNEISETNILHNLISLNVGITPPEDAGSVPYFLLEPSEGEPHFQKFNWMFDEEKTSVNIPREFEKLSLSTLVDTWNMLFENGNNLLRIIDVDRSRLTQDFLYTDIKNDKKYKYNEEYGPHLADSVDSFINRPDANVNLLLSEDGKVLIIENLQIHYPNDTETDDWPTQPYDWETIYEISIRLPVVSEPILNKEISALMMSISKKKELGDFQESFLELYKFSSDLGSANLIEIKRHLRNLMINDMGSVKVLGVDIAIEAIKFFGLGILLCIQVYFCVHLSALCKSGVELKYYCFPWVGVYQSNLATIIFIITLSIFPIITSWLVYQLNLGALSDFQYLLTTLIGVMISLMSLYSIYLFRVFKTCLTR